MNYLRIPVNLLWQQIFVVVISIIAEKNFANDPTKTRGESAHKSWLRLGFILNFHFLLNHILESVVSLPRFSRRSSQPTHLLHQHLPLKQRFLFVHFSKRRILRSINQLFLLKLDGSSYIVLRFLLSLSFFTMCFPGVKSISCLGFIPVIVF